MRLLGLALFTLVLVAFVMLIVSQREQIGTVLRLNDLDVRIERSIELLAGAESHAERQSAAHASLPMKTGSSWTSLSGFPAFAKAEFEIPQNSDIQEAALVLDLTAYLIEGASGRLRISINGARRGEIVLQGGDIQHSLRIELVETDLLRPDLKVSLQTQGRAPMATCSRDWSGAVLVQIEPTSRIELSLGAPLTSLPDLINISGSPNRLVWPENDPALFQADVLAFALANMQREQPTLFIAPSQSVSTDVQPEWIDFVEASRAHAAPRAPALSWPIEVVDLGLNLTAQNFDHQAQWKFTYAQRDLPLGLHPAQLKFGLRVQSANPNSAYVLSVTLNGVLVHATAVQGHSISYDTIVDLPQNSMRNTSEIEITLTNAQVREGICASGEHSVAQLSTSSQLLAGTVQRRTDLALYDLAQTDNLELVVASRLSTENAQRVLHLISDLFPHSNITVLQNQITQYPFIVALPVSQLAQVLATTGLHAANRQIWLAWPKQATTDQQALELHLLDPPRGDVILYPDLTNITVPVIGDGSESQIMLAIFMPSAGDHS